jgi:hypothetical protein
MPLSDANVVQENTGFTTTTSTSVNVTLPLGTTAGNTVVVVITGGLEAVGPAGFVTDRAVGTVIASHKSEVAAGESSWTFTTATGTLFSWYVCEMTNIEPAVAVDASAGSTGLVANGNTATLPTTPLTAALDTVVFGVVSATVTAGDVQSWSNWTDNFAEVADISDPNTARTLAVARRFVTGQTGQFNTTAVFTTSGSPASVDAITIAYAAADSAIVAPLHVLAGFEWGTHGGINSHTGSTCLLGASFATTGGTWGTSYLIQAGSARTSGYGLRVVQSAAAGYVRAGNMNTKAAAAGFNVRVVSATGTVVVASLTANTGTHLAELLYDATNAKFGVRCGTTGTVSWQSGTTATNTWVWVDLRCKTTTSTWHADWRLETGTDTYTDQTAAELGGQSATSMVMLELGASGSQTMTADYDDVVLSQNYSAYPLGPHEIRLLTVDPAGTPTVSGTSTNFSVFTANGTLAAWNATNARDALDEVPPTISASADGVVQTATAASDYMEFPMAAPTVAAGEVVTGVRMLAPAWGGTGAGTGTLGIRGFDGTTEQVLVDTGVSYDAASPTAVSSTEPRWQCGTWPSTNGWTVAKLAAATVRVGFSTDAAPDMGVDAVYLEYAVRKAVTQPMFGTAGDVTVTAAVNPNTLGIRSLSTVTPQDKAATLYYEINTTPTSVSVPPTTADTQTLDAPDQPTTNYVAIYPDPEPGSVT